MLKCKDCEHFRKDHPAGFFPKDPENDLYLCDRYDYYCFKETICIGPIDLDDPDDLEDMDLEDQLEYLLNDDVSEIGYDPYLGCYTDDC